MLNRRYIITSLGKIIILSNTSKIQLKKVLCTFGVAYANLRITVTDYQ